MPENLFISFHENNKRYMGRYSLVIGGKTKNQLTFLVEDIAEVQDIEYALWTSTDTGIGAAGVIAAGLVCVLAFRRKGRKKNK